MTPVLGSVVGSTGAVSRSADGRRWVSVGSSAHPDARRAGEAAALRALAGPDPRLLMVFCSLSRDPEMVLAGVAAAGQGVPVIGCSAREMITPAGPSADGVVVAGLGGSGLAVSTGVGFGVADAPREAGAAAASRVADDRASRPHEVLLLLTDGLAAHQEEVLAGVYRVVGASVPLVGGSSTPDWSTGRTFQLYGDKVLTDAVVAAAIASDGPIGIRRRSGEEVRTVNSTAGFHEGWLRAGAEVPEGGVVWVMEGEEDSVVDAAGDACRTAAEALDGRRPLGFLAFDCVSRASMLGEAGTRAEVDRMTAVGRLVGQADGVPVAGLYTAGEIARTSGISGFHNQTVVILAVG